MEPGREKTLADYRDKPRRPSLRSIIKNILSITGYTIRRAHTPVHPQRQKPIKAQHFFDLYFSLIDPQNFFFIQLGANDGRTRDRMHPYIEKYHLRGILVEPQPDVFQRLKDVYGGNKNLVLENLAIAEHDGFQTLYRVKESLLNKRNFFEATAISSLDKDITKRSLKKRIPHIIDPISENLDDYIDEVPIQTTTLNRLLEKYQVKKLNLLFMDCDGYDHKILNMIDFTNYAPDVINYESVVLTDVDRAQCEELLTKHGYQLFRHGNDTCAFRI